MFLLESFIGYLLNCY